MPRSPARRQTPGGRLASLIVLCASIVAGVVRGGEGNAGYRSALESIRAERLGEYVTYIAHDAFEGRLAGSRGNRQIGEFLAAELKRLNFQPAGANGDYFQPFDPGYRNVLGLLEGRDPAVRDQVILVEAHYDHVGYGSPRTSRGGIGQIHNGADDNGSGTTGLLGLAEALHTLPEAPRRSILICFWDGEELGLLGSKHWIAHPTLPLERVKTVINADMIGRLRSDHLYLYGSRSGCGFRRLVSEQNQEQPLLLDFSWEMKPNGDHWTFFHAGFPTLMFFTGEHDDYHTPRDTADKINREGMQRVVRLMFRTIDELAERQELPRFREAVRLEPQSAEKTFLAVGDLPDRLGAIVDARDVQSGPRLTWVTPGLPGDRAGLRPGDRIATFAGQAVHNAEQLNWLIQTASNPVALQVLRPGLERPLELKAELLGEPMRLGFTWRLDDAEPDTVALTHVVAGSPAAEAGLAVGDRVLAVGGRHFDNEEQFLKLVRQPFPVEFTIERVGRLQTLSVGRPAAQKRAA